MLLPFRSLFQNQQILAGSFGSSDVSDPPVSYVSVCGQTDTFLSNQKELATLMTGVERQGAADPLQRQRDAGRYLRKKVLCEGR